MVVSVEYTSSSKEVCEASQLVLIGSKEGLMSNTSIDLVPTGVSRELWRMCIEEAIPGTAGTKASVPYVDGGKFGKVHMIILPTRNVPSRHNHHFSPHAITALLSTIAWSGELLGIAIIVDDTADAFGAGCAVARAYPLYSEKTVGVPNGKGVVRVTILDKAKGAEGLGSIVSAVGVTAKCIRDTQRLVDSPPNVINCDNYVKECLSVAEEVSAQATVFRMKDLLEKGMGCLEGVGRAASSHSGDPAMVVLSKKGDPSSTAKKVVFVGKGIVFDSGGLALKSKDGMCEMKMDMGGSAACLQAFRASCLLQYPGELHVIMCIAENGIGPTALKPDDVITSYSGKTIEINNPDAEGRLVLADGVAYAVKDLHADVIVDMATLTGAQMMATGQRHGAVITNDADLESALFTAGKASGDLTWPMPYCPEFFRSEFTSRVADMKNSVKNRLNAQVSCAAQFIADQLPADYYGSWAHIDMAGCAMKDSRATGYGVALLVQYLVLGSK